MVKTSDNRVLDGNPFSFIETPIISNVTGTSVRFADDIVPASSNIYDIDGGWRLIEALGGSFTDVTCDTIAAKSATTIQLVNNVQPNFDNQRLLGSSGLRFANGFFNNITTTNTYTNWLIVNSGSTITTDGSLVPDSDNTDTLGTSSNRFLSTHATTVNADTVSSITGNLNLTTNGANNIVANKSVLPGANDTHTLGTETFNWKECFAYTFRQNLDNTFKSFTFGPATVNSSTFTKVGVFLGSGPYDATNNQFKFPTKGFYAITFDSQADATLAGSFNWIGYRLFETTTNQEVAAPLYHFVGGSSAVQNTQITLYCHIDNTAKRVQIEVRKQTGGADVTNVQFRDKTAYVYLIQGTTL